MRFPRHLWRLLWPLLLLLTDSLTAVAALGLALLVRRDILPRIYGGFPAWPGAFDFPPFMLVFLAVLLLSAAFEGLYTRVQPAADEWRHLWRAVFFTTFLFMALVSLGAAADRISRTMVVMTGVVLLGLLPLTRYLLRALAARLGALHEPVLLIARPAGAHTARRFAAAGILPGLEIVAETPPEPLLDHGAPDGERIESFAARVGARSILIAAEGMSGDEVERLAVAASAHLPITRVLPGENSAPLAGMATEYFLRGEAVGLSLRAARLTRPAWRFMKAATDLAFAMVIALVFIPLMLLIAAAVRFDSPGPVFFRQRRLGRGGRGFAVFKFRTMVPDAEKRLDELLQSDPDRADEWTRKFKFDEDPRITRVGRWLRRTSLDELPQLLNVLRLEMALVGPRPIVEAEIALYGEGYADYCRVKPGLTGLWQVSGRSDTSYPRRVFLDRWYARYWSPWLDLAILVRTAFVVLRREGAR